MLQTMASMLRESVIAARLRVSVPTLGRMRQREAGPEWVRIGKQIRYPIGGPCGMEDRLERSLRRDWPPTRTQGVDAW